MTDQPPTSPAPDPAQPDPGGAIIVGPGLIWWGAAFFWAGLVAMITSWFLPTTVNVANQMTTVLYGAEEVANVGLIQRQTVVMISGIGTMLVGVILYAVGKIVVLLRDLRADRMKP